MLIKFYNVKPENLKEEWEHILPWLNKLESIEGTLIPDLYDKDDIFDMCKNKPDIFQIWIAKEDNECLGMITTTVASLPKGNVFIYENIIGKHSSKWFDVAMKKMTLYAKTNKCKLMLAPTSKEILDTISKPNDFAKDVGLNNKRGFQEDHNWGEAIFLCRKWI
ncbi:MAG: hypothetical protein CMO44_15600 [Verrucomicrobiales bacterium]|nr:hypothetical protein [Verrucomicrobiales bacterium]